jgi:uncharacterized protein YebE (UPF0316 family)
MEVLFGAALIFLARVVNIAMATVRMLLSMRGQRVLSAIIGFFETMIFVLAIGQVLQNMGNIWNLLAYCGGFAVGTLVGMEIEERCTPCPDTTGMRSLRPCAKPGTG